MTPADFRRLALSLPHTHESSHMGAPDFRIDNRIFATLAHEKQGFGNLMLSPDQQAEFLAEAPEIFLPVPGGWGRNGATHIRLANATEDILLGALTSAYKLRIQKNDTARKPAPRKKLK